MDTLNLMAYSDASFLQPFGTFEQHKTLDLGSNAFSHLDPLFPSDSRNENYDDTIASCSQNAPAIDLLKDPPSMPKTNGNFLHSIHLLRKSFHKNDAPSEEEVSQLVNTTGLQEYEISIWFDGERSERTRWISQNLLPTPPSTQHLKSGVVQHGSSSTSTSYPESFQLSKPTPAIYSPDGTIPTLDRTQKIEEFPKSSSSPASYRAPKRNSSEKPHKDGKKIRLSGQTKKEHPTSVVEREGHHSNIGQFGCPDCRKFSGTKGDWFLHQDRKHFPKFVYPCRGTDDRPCTNTLFQRRDNFRTHLKNSHSFGSGPGLEAEILDRSVEVRNLFHEICGFCKADLVDREESLMHIWKHIEDGTRVADWEHSCNSQHTLQLHIHYELPSGPSIPSYDPKDDDGDNDGDPNFGASGDGSRGRDGENDSSDRNFDGSFGDSSGGSDSKNGGKDDESSSDSNQSYSYSTTDPHSTSTVEPTEDILPTTVLNSPPGFSVGKYASEPSNITASRGLIAMRVLQYTYKRKRSFITLSAFRGDVRALEAISYSNLVQSMGSLTLHDIYSVFAMLHADGNLASYLRRPDFLTEFKSPASLELLTPGQLMWDSVSSLAAAVSFLHSHNIIHGDFRPENVMIKGHNLCLSGFGVSTEFMNGVGVVRSTPLDAECSAPELAQRAHQSQPADVWALGCILIQIVTRCTGQTLDDLDKFRVSNESLNSSSQHMRELLASLKNCQFKDDQMSNYEATMLFDAIHHMLDENPDARPTANKAFVLLSNLRSFSPDFYVHKRSLGIGICTVEAAQDARTDRSVYEAPAASEDSPRCVSGPENIDHVESMVSSNSHKPHDMGGHPSALVSTENGPSIKPKVPHFSIQPPVWTWEIAFEESQEDRPKSHDSPSNGTKIQKKRKIGDDDNLSNEIYFESAKKARISVVEPPSNNNHAKFACPYRKHDPRKYNVSKSRSCALTPHGSIARLKEHLYRKHQIYQCPRCKDTFKNRESLDIHLMSSESCERVDSEVQVEGITAQIERRLRSKKKAYRELSEVDRWKDIYLTLFPGSEVPSPYFDDNPEEQSEKIGSESENLHRYEDFCRLNLPNFVRESLDDVLSSQPQPLQQGVLISQLPRILAECQDKVFQLYRVQTKGSNVTPPMTLPTSTTSSNFRDTSIGPVSMEKSLFEPSSHLSDTFLGEIPDQGFPKDHNAASIYSSESGYWTSDCESGIGKLGRRNPFVLDVSSQLSFPATKVLESSHETQSDLQTTHPEWEGIGPSFMDMVMDEGRELGSMDGYYDIMMEGATIIDY